ncbi:MAG: hypothetical protein ABSH34_31715 [Verrucomicrobiota bacterium]|jgi:hypothetical protein
MIPTPERSRQILQMRRAGVPRREVALRFKLSPNRISQLEQRDKADKSMAERRAKLRDAIRAADDPEKVWPVTDLADAIGLTGATKNRLLDPFLETRKREISLRELMDMCLERPVEDMDFSMAPLSRICGIGKWGFWSVVNGLTDMGLGSRCNEEWQKTLAKVKQQSRITRATPYSSPVS